MEFIIHTDGGSRGNPGEGAIGVVIEESVRIRKKVEERIIIQFGKRIGICTNNEAEYIAVIEALKNVKFQMSKVKKKDQSETIKIHFFLDSALVCNQLKGLFKVKEPRMREFVVKIRQLESEISIYPVYTLIPREQNSRADKLVNQALNQL